MKRIVVLPLAIVLCVTAAAAQTKPAETKEKPKTSQTTEREHKPSSGKQSKSPAVHEGTQKHAPSSSSDTTSGAVKATETTVQAKNAQKGVKEPVAKTAEHPKQVPHSSTKQTEGKPRPPKK